MYCVLLAFVKSKITLYIHANIKQTCDCCMQRKQNKNAKKNIETTEDLKKYQRRLYQRIRKELIEAKAAHNVCVYVFSNEFSRYTYIERHGNETMDEFRMRRIIKSVQWYNLHLQTWNEQSNLQTILITQTEEDCQTALQRVLFFSIVFCTFFFTFFF